MLRTNQREYTLFYAPSSGQTDVLLSNKLQFCIDYIERVMVTTLPLVRCFFHRKHTLWEMEA